MAKGEKHHIQVQSVTIATQLIVTHSLHHFYMPDTGLSNQQIWYVTVNNFKSKNHYCLCFKEEEGLRPRGVHDLKKATQPSVWEPWFEWKHLTPASHPQPDNHVSISMPGCNMDVFQMSSVCYDIHVQVRVGRRLGIREQREMDREVCRKWGWWPLHTESHACLKASM